MAAIFTLQSKWKGHSSYGQMMFILGSESYAAWSNIQVVSYITEGREL
jgi:hypothetical protein